MKTKIAVALAASALMLGFAPLAQGVDCASGQYSGPSPYEIFPATPRLDCTFGDSVNMAVARQIIDKDAGAKNAAKRTAGMDGVAAKEAIDRYQKSFRSPEPTSSAFTIGVSGGAQSSGMGP
jgi:hypothetical protein